MKSFYEALAALDKIGLSQSNLVIFVLIIGLLKVFELFDLKVGISNLQSDIEHYLDYLLLQTFAPTTKLSYRLTKHNP